MAVPIRCPGAPNVGTRRGSGHGGTESVPQCPQPALPSPRLDLDVRDHPARASEARGGPAGLAQSEQPAIRRRGRRRAAMARARTVSRVRRRRAPVPWGMPCRSRSAARRPCRRRRRGPPTTATAGRCRSECRAEQALDEEHERQRPHRRPLRDAADGHEHRDVGGRAEGARERHRRRRCRACRQRARRSRTPAPAAGGHGRARRPSGPRRSARSGTGRHPGERERAASDLGAEHGVADHERGDGQDQPEQGQAAATLAKSWAARRRTRGRSAPNRTAAAHGHEQRRRAASAGGRAQRVDDEADMADSRRPGRR